MIRIENAFVSIRFVDNDTKMKLGGDATPISVSGCPVFFAKRHAEKKVCLAECPIRRMIRSQNVFPFITLK